MCVAKSTYFDHLRLFTGLTIKSHKTRNMLPSNPHAANRSMRASSHVAPGSLSSFAVSGLSPGGAGMPMQRDESYHLLLELSSQEPTMQACFKIIESTCLARGIDMEISGELEHVRFMSCIHSLSLTHSNSTGKPPSAEFQAFISRYYTPFVENAIRYFFTFGFVPWRLRKLSTGDVVPEAVPFGMFTWTIESVTNRRARGRDGGSVGEMMKLESSAKAYASGGKHGSLAGRLQGKDVNQVAAESSFQKLKAYFSDPKRVPYPLQGDVMRMPNRYEFLFVCCSFQRLTLICEPNRSDNTAAAKDSRLHGFASAKRSADPGVIGAQQSKNVLPERHAGSKNRGDHESDVIQNESSSNKAQRLSSSQHTPAYHRQRAALARQIIPQDDEETKMLRCVCVFMHVCSRVYTCTHTHTHRYCIYFTENCGVMEDDVEVYEYLTPTNSITRYSLLYGTVPSPLSHLLIDYRNIRTTLIRQAYADCYNTQVCFLDASVRMHAYTQHLKKHTHTHTHIGQAHLQLHCPEEHVHYRRGQPHTQRRGLGPSAAAGLQYRQQSAHRDRGKRIHSRRSDREDCGLQACRTQACGVYAAEEHVTGAAAEAREHS